MVATHGPGAQDAASVKEGADGKQGKRMEWILDSGASAHIVNDATVVRGIKATKQKVAMVDSTAVEAQGDCTIVVSAIVNGEEVSITLHNVLLVQEAPMS
jgi:hypothetical protein